MPLAKPAVVTPKISWPVFSVRLPPETKAQLDRDLEALEKNGGEWGRDVILEAAVKLRREASTKGRRRA